MDRRTVVRQNRYSHLRVGLIRGWGDGLGYARIYAGVNPLYIEVEVCCFRVPTNKMFRRFILLALAVPCLATWFLDSPDANPILSELCSVKSDILNAAGTFNDGVFDELNKAGLQSWLESHGIPSIVTEAAETAKEHKQLFLDDLKKLLTTTETTSNTWIITLKEFFQQHSGLLNGAADETMAGPANAIVKKSADQDLEIHNNNNPTAESVNSLLQDTFDSLLREFESRIERDNGNIDTYINDAQDFANAFIKDLDDQTEEDIGHLYEEAEAKISGYRANSDHKDISEVEESIRLVSEHLEKQIEGLSAQKEIEAEKIQTKLNNFIIAAEKSSLQDLDSVPRIGNSASSHHKNSKNPDQPQKKKKNNHKLPEFTTFVTRPTYWRTERLEKYLRLRGFDTFGYKRDELLEIVLGVYKNAESNSKFAVILDSWSSSDLKQILNNANEDASGSREELLDRVSEVYADIATALSQQPETRQKKINEIVDVLKKKSFDNFKGWEPRELREYLDSYGARTDSDYYTLIEAAKDNYYHFIYGFATSRDDGAVTVWGCIVSFFNSLFRRSDSGSDSQELWKRP